jgi:hypothetical protein
MRAARLVHGGGRDGGGHVQLPTQLRDKEGRAGAPTEPLSPMLVLVPVLVITLLLSLTVRLHYVGVRYFVVEAGAVYFKRSTSIVSAELPLQKNRRTVLTSRVSQRKHRSLR